MPVSIRACSSLPRLARFRVTDPEPGTGYGGIGSVRRGQSDSGEPGRDRRSNVRRHPPGGCDRDATPEDDGGENRPFEGEDLPEPVPSRDGDPGARTASRDEEGGHDLVLGGELPARGGRPGDPDQVGGVLVAKGGVGGGDGPGQERIRAAVVEGVWAHCNPDIARARYGVTVSRAHRVSRRRRARCWSTRTEPGLRPVISAT
jgi:hypothetical protein